MRSKHRLARQAVHEKSRASIRIIAQYLDISFSKAESFWRSDYFIEDQNHTWEENYASFKHLSAFKRDMLRVRHELPKLRSLDVKRLVKGVVKIR